SAAPRIRLQLLHRGPRARWCWTRTVSDFSRLGSGLTWVRGVECGDPPSVILCTDPCRKGRSTRFLPTGLEFQKFQGSGGVRFAASPWHWTVLRAVVRGSLGCPGGRWHHLPGHVAIQRAKLPPLATRSRGHASR